MARKIGRITASYTILVVGSGGTGTYFLKEFTHFLGSAPKKVQSMIKGLYVADGDIVEEKNLSRQCFCPDDVGDNKAVAFAAALNDYLYDCESPLCWEPISSYITSVSQIKEIMKDSYYSPTSTYFYNTNEDQLSLQIPVIISCVDNNGARVTFEQFFSDAENCFLYDSGNEFSEGEVCFAHKIKGHVLSPVKSYYFPSILEGDLRQVTELSCQELNVSAPQHLVTNMNAGLQLLLGLVNLLEPTKETVFERIRKKMGFVSFDTFTHMTTFIPYCPECKKEG